MSVTCSISACLLPCLPSLFWLCVLLCVNWSVRGQTCEWFVATIQCKRSRTIGLIGPLEACFYTTSNSMHNYGNRSYKIPHLLPASSQRWKKVVAAATLRVLIFHSCANFVCLFCAILAFLLIFA